MNNINWFELIFTGFEMWFKGISATAVALITIGIEIIKQNPWIVFIVIGIIAFNRLTRKFRI